MQTRVFDGVVKRLDLPGAAGGPLAGKTFMAKDLFDVEGHRTGGGNPDWERTHAPAGRTAPAVQLLLDAGAHLIGKTCTDELAFSLDGINVHCGTPVNPNLPGRIPGGSSSGSASVVAAGLCDFALGTDTAGSVRVPAAYCGIYGLRPTHGRVPIDGVIPLGPTFDTVGWMAGTPQMLAQVGATLLAESYSHIVPLYADKKTKQGARFFLLETGTGIELLTPEFKTLFYEGLELLRPVMGAYEKRELAHGQLDAYAGLFSTIRSFEAWRNHGQWLEQIEPDMDPAIKLRFAGCKATTQSDFETGLKLRRTLTEELSHFLKDGIFCVPSTRDWPPSASATDDELAENRRANVLLNTIASFGGFPQIVIPVRGKDGRFFPLSFISGRGKDSLLLSLAIKLGELSL